MIIFSQFKKYFWLIYIFLSSAILSAQTKPNCKVSSAFTIAYCYQNPVGNPIHQIYSINSDGTDNRQLISTSRGLNHEDWSPDGKNIVAVGYIDASFTTWSIYTFSADGTNLKRITSVNGVADTEPAWSPDGSKIAYTRIFWSPDGTFENSRTELWIINVDGSGQQYIGLEGFAPKWSPDGTKFIYSSNKTGNYEIYTCLVNGTDEQRHTNTTAHETYPVWSPDGKQIAYCTSTGIYNSAAAVSTYEIFVMNADGTNIRQLTNNNSADANPRWSPDGLYLAFVSDRSVAEHHEVYVINIDGTNPQRVTNTPGQATAINPVWRPVGATDVQEGGDHIQNDFQLFHNYPNPFNPTTTMSFTLPYRSFVSMKVYDLLGREVATIVSEELSAGSYTKLWNASDLPSGVYFCRLQARQTSGGQVGSFTNTEKLVLLR